MTGLLMTIAMAAAQAAAPVSADVASANAWLNLIDQGQWQQSWSAAGALFQSKMPQANWGGTIEPVRAPLGAVSARELKGSEKLSSLPGAPPGDYEVLRYQTDFAQKKQATETVILAHEPSGWKVDGYFIR